MIKQYIIFILLQIFLINSSSSLQEINNICNKIIIKHSSSHITAKVFLLNNNFDFTKENFSRKNKIYNFLVGKKLEDDYHIDYLRIIKKYLINKYIIPVLLMWTIFIFFFFTKKCLFKSNLRFEMFFKISKFVIIVIFLLISIFCIIVIYKSNKLQSSINDASCNLLKFFYELNHGNIKDSDSLTQRSDNWPGLFALNSILLETSEQIIKISNKEKDTFSLIETLKNEIEKYRLLINTLDNLSLKGLPNPNIEENKRIIPIYLYEINNKSANSSLMRDIYKDFYNFFLEPSIKLDYVYNYSSVISQKSKTYDLELNQIFDNISYYCYFIKDKSSNLINNIIIFQRNTECIIFFIKLINIIFILFSIIIINLTTSYYYKDLLLIKIILHIIWNFLFFIISLIICVFYFVENLGEIAKHSIYLIQDEVLKIKSNLFFDTCLNTKDSDLNSLFNIYKNDSALIEIDKYYKRIFNVLNSLTNMKTDLLILKKLDKTKNEINKYLNNYELSTDISYKESDITYILNNLSKLTDNSKESKERKNSDFCESKDIWVSSKKGCKDYKYITHFKIKEKFIRDKNEKYCFIIQDGYKEDDLKKIYGDICPREAYIKIVKYIFGLTKYYNNNENLLKNIVKILEDIERFHKKLPEIIIDQIKKCENDLGDLIDIYKPILGDENITNLFKCRRLKRKIINYYDISYNQIMLNTKNINIYIILIISLGFFGILFIIIYNYRNNKEVKKRIYVKLQNKDLNNDGVELIEEVPGEDEDN